MPEFSTKQREKLADEHEAMPDGSYPIRNRADLKRAIQAFGRSKNPEKTKAWIKRRARELDAEDLIPESWLEHFDDSDYLIHYGVLGMKWGVRRANRNSSSSLSKKDQKKIAKAAKGGGESLAKNKTLNSYLKSNSKSFKNAFNKWSKAVDAADAADSKSYPQRRKAAIAEIKKNRDKYGVGEKSTPKNKDFSKAIDYLTIDGKYGTNKTKTSSAERKAYADLDRETKKIMNDVLGKYGSKKAYKISQTNTTVTAKEAVNDYLHNTLIYKKKK